MAFREPRYYSIISPVHGPVTLRIIYAVTDCCEIPLPSGPYFVYQDGLYEAWRQYPDDLDAFEIPVVPHPEAGIGR